MSNLVLIKNRSLLIVLVISLVAIFLNLYPHLYAWRHTPHNFVFTGQASWFDPWDINVYVSAIGWGQTQGFLLENIFDSQHHQPIIYYPIYTLLGMIFPDLNPFHLFYGFSVITAVLLVTTIYHWLFYIFKNKFLAGWLTLITITSGGFGYLNWSPEVAQLSPDLSMTGFTFTSAIQRPHEAIALVALISSLFFGYQLLSEKQPQKRGSLFSYSAITLLVTIFFYPFYALNLLLIWFILIITKKRYLEPVIWKYGLGWFILALFGVLAMSFNLNQNLSFVGVTHQSLSRPALFSFVIGYGFLFFGFIYWLSYYRKAALLTHFLLTWVGVNMSLSLLPLGFARFYLRGVFLPLTILTGQSLLTLIEKRGGEIKEALIKLSLISLLLLTSLSNLVIFFLRLREVQQSNPWYYQSSAQAELISKLKELPQYYQGVLANYYLSNLIPAMSAKRVFLGHRLQTPNFDQRQEWLTQFFACQFNTKDVRQYLDEYQIQYIIWNKNESFNQENLKAPCNYHFLQLIYDNPELALYVIQDK